MQTVRNAFKSSLPVMAGYLVLGAGFGMMMKAAGYGAGWAFAMSLFIYAGSMQYAAVGLLSGGASLLSVALTTLMVNARHLFYGISMLEPYRKAGAARPYLIFSLTDETYSLVCSGKRSIRECLLISLFDQVYWVAGSTVGALLAGWFPSPPKGWILPSPPCSLPYSPSNGWKTKTTSPPCAGWGCRCSAWRCSGRTGSSSRPWRASPPCCWRQG